MNKLAIVVMLHGCGNTSKPVEPVEPVGNAASPCPIPANPEVTQRYAVGAVPDYRVPGSIPNSARCHAEFVANDVIAIGEYSKKLVRPGMFKGHCPGDEAHELTFEAVGPAKATISVAASPPGTPLTLDSKTPDKDIQVLAGVADRCGTPISAGIQDETPSHWAASPGCDKVAKIVPWENQGPHPESALTAIVPIGPGTCTITVELLGATGEATITVN